MARPNSRRKQRQRHRRAVAFFNLYLFMARGGRHA